MWSFLANLLSKVGLKVAEKGAEKVAGKTAMSVAQKIAGAAKTASAINPQNKSTLSKILNVVTGDLGENLESTGSTLGRAGELPKGSWFRKAKSFIVGDLDKAAKNASVAPELTKAVSNVADQPVKSYKLGGLSDIINNIKPQQPQKGQKLADTVNNVLFGEGFGSNVLRRTMANAAQQGIFSSSDVGQPEKDKWGILGNSVLGGVAGAAVDNMQQQFDNKQMLSKMMTEFNPADEAMKNFQPKALEEINGFRDYIIQVGANKKGLQKGKYNSQEMLDITNKFSQLQKKIGSYMQSDTRYRKDYGEFQQNSTKYDPVDFRMGSEYFLKTGNYPTGGLLTPAEVDPETFFPNLSLSNKDAWKPIDQNAPYELQSPLPADKKKLLAGTYFYTNPGLQKHIMRRELPQWKQQYSGDKELMNMFTNPQTGQFDDMKFAEFMTAQNYGDKIEQNKVDWEKKAKYMEERRDTAKKTAEELQKEEEKRGYSLTQNYPYDNKQSGPAIVFKKNYAENIPPQILQDATGSSISTDDEVVPVNFEYVDKSGNLVVTAAVNEAGTARKRRLNIPANKSKGLLESYFPGITSDPKTESMFNPKNAKPVGVLRSNEISGFDPKTGKMAVFNSDTKQFIRWAE